MSWFRHSSRRLSICQPQHQLKTKLNILSHWSTLDGAKLSVHWRNRTGRPDDQSSGSCTDSLPSKCFFEQWPSNHASPNYQLSRVSRSMTHHMEAQPHACSPIQDRVFVNDKTVDIFIWAWIVNYKSNSEKDNLNGCKRWSGDLPVYICYLSKRSSWGSLAYCNDQTSTNLQKN